MRAASGLFPAANAKAAPDGAAFFLPIGGRSSCDANGDEAERGGSRKRSSRLSWHFNRAYYVEDLSFGSSIGRSGPVSGLNPSAPI